MIEHHSPREPARRVAPELQELGFIEHRQGPLLDASDLDLPSAFDLGGVDPLHTESLTTDRGNVVYACSMVSEHRGLSKITSRLGDSDSDKANQIFLSSVKGFADGTAPNNTQYTDRSGQKIYCCNRGNNTVFVYVTQICAINGAPVFAKLAACRGKEARGVEAKLQLVDNKTKKGLRAHS